VVYVYIYSKITERTLNNSVGRKVGSRLKVTHMAIGTEDVYCLVFILLLVLLMTFYFSVYTRLRLNIIYPIGTLYNYDFKHDDNPSIVTLLFVEFNSANKRQYYTL